MRDLSADFFAGLSQRARAVLPPTADGTIRIDLIDSNDRVEHWLVVLDHGNARVSQENQPADMIITTNKDLFTDLVTGEEEPGPHLYQGDFDMKGTNQFLWVHFRRLLPDLKGARDPRTMAHPRKDRGR
jgi:hypothetical protein